MDLWEQRQMQSKRQLEGIFAAADSNDDGVLSLLEFEKLVTDIVPTMTRRGVREIYGEIVTHPAVKDDRIPAGVFAAVLQKRGVLVLKSRLN
jgi:hypothetical protein